MPLRRPQAAVVIPRSAARCMGCTRRVFYWVEGSTAYVKCLSPCENAAERIRGREERAEPAPKPAMAELYFYLDRDDAGNHTVTVHGSGTLSKDSVIDPRDIDSDSGLLRGSGAPRKLSIESTGVIRKMQLSEHTIRDRRLVFPFSPLTLSALRSLLRVRESERSRGTKIRHASPFEKVNVDYDPARGVTLKPVYTDDDGRPADPQSVDVPRGYARVGDTWYILPHEARRILEKPGVDLADIPEFFLRDLILLETDFTAVLSEEAKRVTVVEAPLPPTVDISLTEPGWLDFNIVIDTRYTREGVQASRDGEYARTGSHSWVRRPEQQLKQQERDLEALGAQRKGRGYRIGLSSFASLEEFIDRIGGVRSAAEEYRQFLEQITDFRHDDGYTLPEEVELQLEHSGRRLFPYQRSGVQWLNWLFGHNLHGLLADDMGLGKTLQSLASMRCIYDDSGSMQPSLIVCPVAVIKHWASEIRAVFGSHVEVVEHHGPSRSREKLHRRRPAIYISSYDTVVADIEELRQVPWLFVVLDEGTKIKNPGTQRSQAMKVLNAAHKVSLSGTPIENRPAELWSVFDFLMPGHLGSYHEFLWRYEKPIIEQKAEPADELKRRIRPFILRRKKENVAKDLPEKIESVYWVELSDEQKILYKMIQDSEVSPMQEALLRGDRVGYVDSILPVIMKLRQLCDHPAMVNKGWTPALGRSEKFDSVVEAIEEVAEAGESCVVFTNFLGTLNLLETVLTEKGLTYIRIDGQTRDRQGLIDRFNAGGITAALCSVLASGHGINLTAANHVIHVDNWFSPAVEDQATDRVHRIGQTRTVLIHKFLVRNTLEEKIDALIKRKRRIINGIIDAEIEGEKFWTRDELLEILKPLKNPDT